MLHSHRREDSIHHPRHSQHSASACSDYPDQAQRLYPLPMQGNYAQSARMGYTVPRFTAQCSQCAASRDLLWLGWLSSDSAKYKGASCVQGIKYADQNRQKRKKPCAAFNTQHRAFLCLISDIPQRTLSASQMGSRLSDRKGRCGLRRG